MVSKEFYDKVWKDEIDFVIGDNYEHYRTKYLSVPKFQLIENHISAIHDRNSILEIGCGSGRVLAYFKEKFNINKAIGIDISERAITFAKKQHPDCNFLVHEADKEVLPFKDREIDIVILCDIVEHVGDYDNLIKESIRISKHVVIKVPLEGTILQFVLTLFGRKTALNKKHEKGHIHAFTPHFFERYFKKLKKEKNIRVCLTHSDGLLPAYRYRVLRLLAKQTIGTPFYKYLFSSDLGIYIHHYS